MVVYIRAKFFDISFNKEPLSLLFEFGLGLMGFTSSDGLKTDSCYTTSMAGLQGSWSLPCPLFGSLALGEASYCPMRMLKYPYEEV